MVVTKALTMVAAHGKQLLRHLVNLGQNKRMYALGTGANCMSTGPQRTIRKKSECNKIPQQIRPTVPSRTKYM